MLLGAGTLKQGWRWGGHCLGGGAGRTAPGGRGAPRAERQGALLGARVRTGLHAPLRVDVDAVLAGQGEGAGRRVCRGQGWVGGKAPPPKLPRPRGERAGYPRSDGWMVGRSDVQPLCWAFPAEASVPPPLPPHQPAPGQRRLLPVLGTRVSEPTPGASQHFLSRLRRGWLTQPRPPGAGRASGALCTGPPCSARQGAGRVPRPTCPGTAPPASGDWWPRRKWA